MQGTTARLAPIRSAAVERNRGRSQLALVSWAIAVVAAVVIPLFVFIDGLYELTSSDLGASLIAAAAVAALTVILSVFAMGLDGRFVAMLALGSAITVPVGQELHDVKVDRERASEAANATLAAARELASAMHLRIDPESCRVTSPSTRGGVESVVCAGPVGPGSSVVLTRFESPERMGAAFRRRRDLVPRVRQGVWSRDDRVRGRVMRGHTTSRTVVAFYDHDALVLAVAIDSAPDRKRNDLRRWIFPGSFD